MYNTVFTFEIIAYNVADDVFGRFLRKEKEIAQSKLEIVQTECSNVKHRYERQQKELEEVRRTLTEQQIKAQVTSAVDTVIYRTPSHIQSFCINNCNLGDCHRKYCMNILLL